MPETFQKKLLRILQNKPRNHKGCFEKRATINGIPITGTGKTPEICEEKFFAALERNFFSTKEEPETSDLKRDLPFEEWAETWFTVIFKPGVSDYTYHRQQNVYLRHILPFFRGKPISSVSYLDCMKYFNLMQEKNIERTTEFCYGILSRIFAAAYEEELIRRNPMKKIKPVKHERTNGVPLTKDEERYLLQKIRGERYEAMILVALYAGLRPCELDSAYIENGFIVARNRKQKKATRIVYKKIPITPMLMPHRSLLETMLPILTKEFSILPLRTLFKRFLPEHRLYDLRDTFATRCQECGVPENVVQLWMGHSAKTLLGQVYTKFSDEYLLKEGLKVKY